MRSIKKLAILVVGLMVSLAVVSEAAPMGTAWTYQGRLMDANEPGDGLYDFQFKLFNDPCTGTQQGSTIEVNDLDVIDGYFTTEVDFGSSVFNGNARWLEIDVRPGDSIDISDYATLTPRQEVSPTPYALQTRGIFVNSAENVGIGTTTPTQKVTVQGARPRIGLVEDGGDAAILEFHEQENQLRLQHWTDYGNTWIRDMMVLDGDTGNVGIGTANPLNNLHVYNSAGHAYVKAESEGGYAFFMADGNYNSGLTIKENGTNKADVYWNTANDSLSLAQGGVDRVVVKGGNVGIGTPSPQAKLHVDGELQIGSEPNSVKIHGMILLTGESTNNTLIYLLWPAGYTSSNSMVVSAEVKGNGEQWRSIGYHPSTISGELYYTLGSDAIRIFLPDIGFNPIKPYRVLLMKIK